MWYGPKSRIQEKTENIGFRFGSRFGVIEVVRFGFGFGFHFQRVRFGWEFGLGHSENQDSDSGSDSMI